MAMRGCTGTRVSERVRRVRGVTAKPQGGKRKLSACGRIRGLGCLYTQGASKPPCLASSRCTATGQTPRYMNAQEVVALAARSSPMPVPVPRDPPNNIATAPGARPAVAPKRHVPLQPPSGSAPHPSLALCSPPLPPPPPPPPPPHRPRPRTFGSLPSSDSRQKSSPCLLASGGYTSTLSCATARTCCSLSLSLGWARIEYLTWGRGERS